jgi:hypothetical protein
VLVAALITGTAQARADEPQGAASLASPMTISPTFGQHYNLVGGMAADGEVKLVWRSIVGVANTIQVATIAPGVTEASSAIAVSRAEPRISEPALAVASASRAAVAWFDERETGNGSGEILALQVRNQLPRQLEPLQTVWRTTHRAGYENGGLAIAVNQAGDEVAAWMVRRANQPAAYEWTVMVASRSAGGTFTAPATLTTDSPDTLPAVAMSPNGEATVLWCDPDDKQVLEATWLAGHPPLSSVVLDQSSSAESQASVGDLHIQTDESGDEIATWLSGIQSSGRPHIVALRAAWRQEGGSFAPAQSVTSPGVEARAPSVALSTARGALIAWTEITSSGSGPVLNYATAPMNAEFTTGSPIAAALGEHPELQDSWLPNGSALISWRDGGRLLADRWTPGDGLPAPALVAHLGENAVQVAAGGNSPPVVAWIGRSPSDSAPEAVRYMSVNGLTEAIPAEIAPLLKLAGGRDFVRKRGVAIDIRCSEACAVTASARLFGLRTENAEEAAGGAYQDIGAFLTLRRGLSAGADEMLRVRSTPKLLQAYCRSVHRHDNDAVEVRVSVRGLTMGPVRNVVLGMVPDGRSCSR